MVKLLLVLYCGGGGSLVMKICHLGHLAINNQCWSHTCDMCIVQNLKISISISISIYSQVIAAEGEHKASRSLRQAAEVIILNVIFLEIIWASAMFHLNCDYLSNYLDCDYLGNCSKTSNILSVIICETFWLAFYW